MDQLICGLEDFDLVIYSQHVQHLCEVLQRLKEANLTARARKCQGHRVGGGLVHPEDAKIAAIRKLSVPTTKKDVKSFLILSPIHSPLCVTGSSTD